LSAAAGSPHWGGMIVVESENGHHKAMALGKASPEETAEQSLVQLEEAQNPFRRVAIRQATWLFTVNCFSKDRDE
jgi:hypothetical protein